MVKLRLSRFGRKGEPTYRLVATDSKNKRDGRAIEELGYIIPKNKQMKLETERIQYWLSVGAQPSETVARMLVREGLLDKSKLPVRTFGDKPGKQNADRKEAKAAKVEAANEAKNKPAEPVAEEVSETVEEVKAEEATEAVAEEVKVEETPAETTEAA